VERRDAKPGSDLYEKLLAVGRDGIVYLSLEKGEIARRDIAIADIAAVRLAQELLYGLFCVDLTDGGSVSMAFNTVSADLVQEFIDAARALCVAGTENRRFAPTDCGYEPGDENILFQNLLASLRAHNVGLKLLAYQPPFLMESEKLGRRSLSELMAGLLRRRLDGCLLAATPSELIFLVRGLGIPRIGKSKGYRYEAFYLPVASFRSAAVEPRVLANGASFYALRLFAAGRDYELLFEKDPSNILSCLSP